MSYSTTTDLVALTGSDLDTATLQALIDLADAEIDAKLAMADISGGSGNDLKLASLRLSTSLMLTRYRMDGTKPASISTGIVSMSDNIDVAISELRDEALELVDGYIRRNSSQPHKRGYYVHVG